MVQKFVKELSDSAKQPDRSDSAEHTATEQVETTAREIAHEAVQLPRGFSHRTHYTESTEHLQPEQPISPRPTSEIPRQRTETVRARPDTTPAPTPQEQGRRAYIQQAAKATTTPPITPESPQERPTPATPTPENVPRQNLQSPRQRADDFRTRVETRTPQSTPAPTPQEQGRRAYVQQTAKAAAAPRTVPPEQPQNYHTTPEVSPQEDLPRQNPQSPRLRTDDFRARAETRAPQSAPAFTPQEHGRRAYVQQAAKATPPITPESPQERPTSAVPTLENVPRQASKTPQLRADDVRLRPEPDVSPRKPTPASQELGRRVFTQKAAKETAKTPVQKTLSEQPVKSEESPTENIPRLRTENVRTRPDAQKPQSTSAPTAQEQGRRAYVRQAKKSRAEKTSAQDIHTEPPEIRLVEDLPEHEPLRIREKPTLTELCGELPPEATPEKAPNIRHIKQTGTWTPRAAEPSNRGVELPIRERIAGTPTHDLPSIPQEQTRKIFAEKQAQLAQNPSIESIYPSEPAGPIPPQPPVSDAPATTPKRQPLTAGSKPAPPVQSTAPAQAPPVEQPARHPREAEAKRRAEREIPARR